MAEYFDMHCHLDFAANATQVADEAEKLGISALSATVTPEGYKAASATLRGFPAIHVGLGFHPWWIRETDESRAALERFEHLAPCSPVVGEVGLDFSGRATASPETQVEFFRRILDTCTKGKLLTIHAVRSVDTVLDLLDEFDILAANYCVFHWFSGSSQELSRAIKVGCYFSVGPHMMKSKKGREYARVIPLKRLLMETDEPPESIGNWSAVAWHGMLSSTLTTLAELRDDDPIQIQETVAATSMRLFSLSAFDDE